MSESKQAAGGALAPDAQETAEMTYYAVEGYFREAAASGSTAELKNETFRTFKLSNKHVAAAVALPGLRNFLLSIGFHAAKMEGRSALLLPQPSAALCGTLSSVVEIINECLEAAASSNGTAEPSEHGSKEEKEEVEEDEEVAASTTRVAIKLKSGHPVVLRLHARTPLLALYAAAKLFGHMQTTPFRLLLKTPSEMYHIPATKDSLAGSSIEDDSLVYIDAIVPTEAPKTMKSVEDMASAKEEAERARRRARDAVWRQRNRERLLEKQKLMMRFHDDRLTWTYKESLKPGAEVDIPSEPFFVKDAKGKAVPRQSPPATDPTPQPAGAQLGSGGSA